MNIKKFVTYLVTFLVFSLATVFQIRNLSPDPDTFWHLAAGKWILTNHQIPYSDPFNMVNPRRWMDHEWLSQVVFSFLSNLGYYFLVSFVIGLSIVILVILYRFLQYKGMSRDIALMTILLISGPLSIFMRVRPQIFTYFLSLMLVITLEKWHQNWKSRWLLLSIIIILWVNFHGGGLSFAYVLLVGYLVCFFVEKQYSKVKEIASFIAFSVLLQLANPYGFSMIVYPYQVMLNSDMGQYISEWKSPDFHSNFILLIYIALIILILAVSKAKSFKNTAFILGLLTMSLMSIRHVALFLLLSPIFLADSIVKWKITFNKTKVLNWTVIASSFIVLIALLVKGNPKIPNILSTESAYNPTSAFSYLSEHHITGKIYNSYNFGGSLLYNFKGEIIPSSDGRADMYTSIYNEEDYFHEETSLLLSNSLNPSKFFELYTTKILLVESDSWLNQWLKNNKTYQLLYEDEIATIYGLSD